MYIVLLKFSMNKAHAARYMEGHNSWIQRGVADGVFLVVGALQPNQGGAVVAYNATLAEIEARVSEDPFVAENVVSAEILQITPAKVDQRMEFLMG